MVTSTRTQDDDGTVRWITSTGILHRLDGPALLLVDGSKLWFDEGMYHRDDGPAVEWSVGNNAWYLHGRLHRVDGPAIDYGNHKTFFLDDEYIADPHEFCSRVGMDSEAKSDFLDKYAEHFLKNSVDDA